MATMHKLIAGFLMFAIVYGICLFSGWLYIFYSLNNVLNMWGDVECVLMGLLIFSVVAFDLKSINLKIANLRNLFYCHILIFILFIIANHNIATAIMLITWSIVFWAITLIMRKKIGLFKNIQISGLITLGLTQLWWILTPTPITDSAINGFLFIGIIYLIAFIYGISMLFNAGFKLKKSMAIFPFLYIGYIIIYINFDIPFYLTRLPLSLIMIAIIIIGYRKA